MTVKAATDVNSIASVFQPDQNTATSNNIVELMLRCILDAPQMKNWVESMASVKLKDYVSVVNFRYANGTLKWPNPKLRDCYRSAVSQVVHKMALERISSTDRILELGAGEPVYGCQSFLVSLFPVELRKRIQSSDINPKIVAEANVLGFPRFVHIDSSKLSSAKSIDGIDKIIAANFLDTLSKENLTTTLSEIAKVLRPGGELIHISDVDPFLHGFVSQHVTDDNIPFVLTRPNGQTQGLLIMDKATYFKTVRPLIETKLPKIELMFLDWYAKLSKLEKEYVLTSIQKNAFSEWFKSIIPPQFLTIVDRNSWYENSLKVALAAAGLNIIKMEKQAGTELQSKNALPLPDGANCLSNDQGHINFHFVNAIPPDAVRVICNVHVLIAQKLGK